MGKKVEYGDEVLQRVKKIRGKLGLTQKEMGEKILLKRTSYSSIEQGHNALTAKHVQLICEILKVRKEYLLHGEEPMFEDNEVNYGTNSVVDEERGNYKNDVNLKRRLKELEEEVEMYKAIVKKMLEK